MAKLSLRILVIVLLTTAAATILTATADAPAKALSEGQSLTDDLCPFWFKFTSCWVSIAKVDGCAAELVKSITSFRVGISADCCNAITDVSDKCFSIFGALFAPLLKSHCIAFFPNASLAESPQSSA
jgi:Prolamin-like